MNRYNAEEAAERTGVDQEDVVEVLMDMTQNGMLFSTHVHWPEDHYMSEYNDV